MGFIDLLNSRKQSSHLFLPAVGRRLVLQVDVNDGHSPARKSGHGEIDDECHGGRHAALRGNSLSALPKTAAINSESQSLFAGASRFTLHPGLSLTISPTVSLIATHFSFWRTSLSDGIYSQPGFFSVLGAKTSPDTWAAFRT
jgi:hypothetical protein